MEKNKKKLDELTKAKLIYSIELAVFAVVFAVIGILNLVKVIVLKDWRVTLFLWLTSIGGFIFIIDLVWILLSPKRKAKNSLIDKILLIPSALFLSSLSIYQLANGISSFIWWELGIGFIYFALIYIFEAIYHWFYPVPGLLEEDNKEEKIENKDDTKIEEKNEEK